ncbi:MAG: hypothetical protein ACKODB_12665 [Betaproteobacteria bacterium]
MLTRRYLEFIALYLGIALVGGAIVHMPGSPTKNVVIMLVGMALFLAASLREARAKVLTGESAGAGRFLVLSAMLSIGLGMISGSIQHFDEFPDYGSILIPCGIGLSLPTFGMRESLLPGGARLAALVVALGLALPIVWLGLHEFAHFAFGDNHH